MCDDQYHPVEMVESNTIHETPSSVDTFTLKSSEYGPPSPHEPDGLGKYRSKTKSDGWSSFSMEFEKSIGLAALAGSSPAASSL